MMREKNKKQTRMKEVKEKGEKNGPSCKDNMQSTSKRHLGKICLQHRPSITQHPFLVTSPLQLKLYFIYFFISQYRHASRVILTIYITCISVRNRLWLLYIDSFIFPSQMYTQTRALYRLSPNILYIKNPFFFFIWVFFFLKDAQ